MRLSKNSFTLLEVLLTVVLLTIGVVAICRAFSIGLFVATDAENVDLALNIARARMEQIKDTSFVNLADSGPVSDPNFPNFNVTVDVAEGQNPMQVNVTVSWQTKGGETGVTLTTLAADY